MNIQELIKKWDEEKIPQEIQALMLCVLYLSVAKLVVDILKKIKDG